MSKVEILLPEDIHPVARKGLDEAFTVHAPFEAADPEALIARVAGNIRGLARGYHMIIGRDLLARLPKLEIIAGFGVGYDGIDLGYAAENGIVVTNTPDVLTEEVADTTIGLLLMTIRELSAAERYLRAGDWVKKGNFPLTKASLRGRTVGMIGLGRIGLAIARRLEAMHVAVAYHTRTPRPDVPYRYYDSVLALAKAVDTLIVMIPGTPETRKIVNAEVLKALGPDGVLISMGRGITIDDDALIEALKTRTIHAAGMDVYTKEPQVPEGLLALDNVVLLPHVGSGSQPTRAAMAQLVVDNLKSWFDDGKPLTPVPETPWPRK